MPACESVKAKKRADGIERDQAVGDAAESDEHAATEQRQHDDAVGIDQSPSAVAEDVREIIVLRDGAAKAREIGESRVRGERQNEQEWSRSSGSRRCPCRKPRR